MELPSLKLIAAKNTSAVNAAIGKTRSPIPTSLALRPTIWWRFDVFSRPLAVIMIPAKKIPIKASEISLSMISALQTNDSIHPARAIDSTQVKTADRGIRVHWIVRLNAAIDLDQLGE